MKPTDIKNALTKKPEKSKPEYVSTGSTLLNLGISGHPKNGFQKGRYYLFVGDSSSGKTFLALTCLAEAANNPKFDGYELIHWDAEYGALMDFKKFFGSKTASRVRKPEIKTGTVEECFDYINDLAEKKQPFVMVIDSMDSLETIADQKKRKEQKKARSEDSISSGSYGTSKSKVNAQNLPKIINDLEKTNSILIIISQTRDNIGFMVKEKKTRGGGHALKFYATVEIWTSIKESIKKRIKGKDRKLGVISKVQLKKNRITGKDRVIYVPIYNSIGIDDIGSCVDFLVEEKHWRKTGSSINAPEFNVNGDREQIIRAIEFGDLEEELYSLVTKVWNEIEQETEITRKSRYE